MGAAEYEKEKGGGVSIKVKSWMKLEAQIDARGVTWLDEVGDQVGEVSSARHERALNAREPFLRGAGLLREDEATLLAAMRRALMAEELKRVAAAEAARSGRSFSTLSQGDRFEGRFEKIADLAQGRMAVIGNEDAFAMVPWRASLERQRG